MNTNLTEITPIRLDCENILGIFDAVNDCLVKFLQEFNEIIELFILKMGFILKILFFFSGVFPVHKLCIQ